MKVRARVVDMSTTVHVISIVEGRIHDTAWTAGNWETALRNRFERPVPWGRRDPQDGDVIRVEASDRRLLARYVYRGGWQEEEPAGDFEVGFIR